MESRMNNIIRELLNYELDNVIHKLEFDNKKKSFDVKLLLDSIGLLDDITIKESSNNKSAAITIIALLWNLYGSSYNGLKDILIKMLARIGYSPASIIMDSDFKYETQQFSSMNSIINEISIGMKQSQYEIKVFNKKFVITDFQREICGNFKDSKFIGISAPTSAGKSFILVLKSVEYSICNKSDIIYIVPTLSLVSQVSEDYKKMFRLLDFDQYDILNSYVYDNISEKIKVYVLTQEKAISAFCNEKNPFSSNSILIIDEIQNIERVGVESDTRSKILYDTIFEFRNKEIINKVIISGPRIDEIDILSNKLFGIKNAKKIETNISPVLNLTYSISKSKDKYFLKQYCALFNEPITREIKNNDIISGYAQKRYDEKFLKYLSKFIDKFDKDDQNIIFAPTSKTARNVALSITTENNFSENQKILQLINYFRVTVHPEYSLCKTLENNVAYHHGKLPAHVRRTIEKATTLKLVNNIVCTTTLMQGMNLPVQNIIIRNPHLYINKRKNSAELSSYEMTNLRGRAGRLLKDFIGRTYVLDESEFLSIEDDYNQIDLFGEVTKEIDSNYESKFKEYEYDIKDSLDNKILSSQISDKYGYLVTYIRQTILKHNENSYKILKDVGILISKEEIKKLNLELMDITVPKEICFKNRYWDPLVLNSLYKEKLPELPYKAMERGIQTKIRSLLKFLRDNPKYKSIFEKYIIEEYRNSSGLSKLCKLCTQWLNQVSLEKILSNQKSTEDISDKIETNISLLQNTISYGIPLLLSPIYDMKLKGNMFLTYIETGAFKPLARKMIEMGIPRETAIYISENYFMDIVMEEEVGLKDRIIDELKKIYPKLEYWIAVQIEYLI